MSVAGKIWHGTLSLTSSGILARASTFLGNLVLIRSLGLDNVGHLGLVESWLTIATTLALAGVSVATTRYVSYYAETDPRRCGSLAGTSLMLTTLASLVVGAGFWVWLVMAPGVQDTRAIMADRAMLLFGLVTLFTLKLTLTAVLLGLQSFGAFVLANALLAVLSLPVIYVFVSLHGLTGALESRLVLSLVEAAPLAYAVWMSFRRLRVPITLNRFRRDARQLIGLGLPAFLGQLPSAPLQAFLMSFLAAQPGGLAQLGLFATATRLTSLASFVPSAMATTLVPVLAAEWGSGEGARFKHSTVLALRMLWLTALPATLLLLAASPTLVTWLYGEQFRDAWPIACGLLVVSFMTSLNEPADRAFTAAGRQWLSSANNYVGVALLLPLSLALIPPLLGQGFALATVVAFALFALLQIAELRLLFAIPLREVGRLVPWTLAALGAAVGVAWSVSGAPFVQVVVAVGLTAVVVLIEGRFLMARAERAAVAAVLAALLDRGCSTLYRVGRWTHVMRERSADG